MKLFKGPRRKAAIVATAIAATVVVGGGAALAAMLLTGEGTARAEAYQGRNLVVSNEAFNKEVYPGVVADLTFRVTNENPFPVTIQKVAVDTARPSAIVLNCAKPADAEKLSGPAANVSGLSYSIPSAEQVVIPAKTGAGNGVGTVTIAGALRLAPEAEGGCTVQVPFKVTGAGSGN